MKEEDISFYSDGHKLYGSIYIPEVEKSDKLFLTCSGFMGLNNIHPARFARGLTEKGHVCAGFDFRGFGKSDGSPSHVILDEQIRDITNLITYLKNMESLKDKKIVLIGWGMAGGLIFKSAKISPEISGLISCNGFFNNRRVQKSLRGEKGWNEFYAWYMEEQRKEIQNGEEKEYMPFDFYPLDEVTKGYVYNVLYKNPDFDRKVKIGFAQSLISFSIEENDSFYKDIPLLIAHGDQNKLHPIEEANSLMDNYQGNKELYWIKDAGHTEWMFDDNPKFISLIEKINQWTNEKC